MNCDRIARWYRWLEYAGFGGALQRRRLAFLDQLTNARRVLVLGDGDGRALQALLDRNRQATVDSIDLSGRMLELARARAGQRADRVTFRQADALTASLPEGEYDLIVTHFFLDCFDQKDLSLLVERLAQAAQPRAQWVISEFRKPGLMVAFLYLFFRAATGLKNRRLVDYHPLLAKQGFELKRSASAWGGRLVSELWTRNF